MTLWERLRERLHDARHTRFLRAMERAQWAVTDPERNSVLLANPCELARLCEGALVTRPLPPLGSEARVAEYDRAVKDLAAEAGPRAFALFVGGLLVEAHAFGRLTIFADHALTVGVMADEDGDPPFGLAA